MAMSRGVTQWISISIGSLTIETGTETDYYAPDVMRDAWTQAVRGLSETIEAGGAPGLVQYSADDDDTDDTEADTGDE